MIGESITPRRAVAGRGLAVSAPLAGVAASLAGATFLLTRLVPDVAGKPLFEDEAVAGLLGSRPLLEQLGTVMWDRGGAPLHFVLAHVTLGFDSSPAALRWLSVVFALATIPLCFDLGRRLAGVVAGATAAIVASTSAVLAVYGTVGRMYALFAFASALAADLFVRALEQRTGRAALAAAAAAWLLPAVHPYGALFVGAEALVALAVWRGRPLRPALPVLAVALALLPFAAADLRLADRFTVSVEGETSLAGPGDAWSQLVRALASFAGGEGWTFAFFLGFGLAGAWVLLRRNPAFVALVLLAVVAAPLLFVLLRTESVMGFSPRHLVFALPLWAAVVGVGVERATRGLSPPAVSVALVAVALVAGLAPTGGIRDPRDWPNVVLGGGHPASAPGSAAALAEPSTWLRGAVGEGDVLFPFSTVFFAGLPATGDAVTLPYSQPKLLERAVERVELPIGDVFVAVPVGEAAVDLGRLRDQLGAGYEVRRFPSWLLVRAEGPFAETSPALEATFRALEASLAATEAERYPELAFYLNRSLLSTCETLASPGRQCAR